VLHHGLQHRLDPLSRLGRDLQDLVPPAPDDLSDLVSPLLGFGPGEVDLVEHRDYLQVVLKSKQGVGQRLRLDPLRGVHHQDDSFAGCHAPRDLVGEVHVARGVYEVELVILAVVGAIGDAHGLGLDGDAPLALQVHAVEHLLTHIPVGHGVGHLQDAVGQGGLPVVDVGDDAEVADMFEGAHGREYSSGKGAHRPLPEGPGAARPPRALQAAPSIMGSGYALQ
jgi:hypothetical protein